MTVRMRKGKKFADIHSSQECIERAKKDGWTLVQEQQTTAEAAESAAEEKAEEKTETTESTTKTTSRSRSRKKTS